MTTPGVEDYEPWFDAKHPMNYAEPRRISLDELERILKSEEDVAIEILPNGEIRATDGISTHAKPLTMRENLGGEYGAAS